MGTRQLRSLYQVKISLVDSKPPIWRRLLVHGNIRLNIFHTAIQYSMGWQNYHLHQFEKDRIIYGLPDDGGNFGFDVKDESKFRLSDVLEKEKDTLTYDYDFGDNWRHKITLEKILPFEASSELVKCIKGKRSCPPEDCGGIWGYDSLLEVISDPSHSEHKTMLDWLGGEFDPEYFSISETNNMLSEHIK